MKKQFAGAFLSAALLLSLIAPSFAVDETDVPAADEASTPEATEAQTTQEGTDETGEDEAQESTDETDESATEEGEETEREDTEDAASSSYPDLAGHWARDTMLWAVEAGYLSGFEDGTLRPDAVISKAEILTVLMRVLEAEKATTLSGISEDAWYREAAEMAAYLEIIYDASGLDSESIPRGEAFVLLNRAFCLSDESYDFEAAELFTDVNYLGAEELNALSGLARYASLGGYGDGEVRTEGTLTRAEFVSLLSALLPTEDSVLTGEIILSEGDYSTPVYIAPTVEHVTLTDVTMTKLVLRNPGAVSLTLSGESRIETIVMSAYAPEITVKDGAEIGEVVLMNDRVKWTQDFPLETLQMRAQGQKVTVSDSVDTIYLSGKGSEVLGDGSLGMLYSYTDDYTLALEYMDETKVEVHADRGIENVSMWLHAASSLPVGELLTATVHMKNDEPKTVRGIWYVGDTIVKEEELFVGPQETSSTYEAMFEYSRDMNTNFAARFELHYQTVDGITQVKSIDVHTTLENHPDSYYDQYDIDQVLARVKTGYAGDYTLAWAEANDYDALTKEIWMNAKGHSSATQYLIWINIRYQRVNIFEGSQGNWTLIRENIVGTGRNGHNTPVGTYTTTYNQTGWTTGSYHVSPVVRFKAGSGLAFHSRKYNPGGTYLIDPSIGYPISLGCIRMYDEDIDWIYNNVPSGTKVVVY